MKIKSALKKYKVFLLLLIANLILGFFSPKIGVASLHITKSNLMEMLSVIPPIFILLGLLDVWVEKETMIRYLGKGSGFKGALIAFVLGSAAAGPLYAAFPIATVMIKKGSSMFNVFIFIGAWSTTKIPMLTFEAASLGVPFAVTRLLMNIVGIAIIALVVEKSLTKQEQEEVYKMAEKQ